MDSEKGFWQRLGIRVFGHQADIGFFQEIDPKTDKLTNSSTRLFQAFFAWMLYINSKVIITNVFENDTDLGSNEMYMFGVMYLLNVVAILAPKMIKNSEVVQSFLTSLKHKEEKA